MTLASCLPHARAVFDEARRLVALSRDLRMDMATTRAACARLRRCHPRFIGGGSRTGDDRAERRRQIRAWLAEGRLPLPGAETWVGPGSERWCAICSTMIQRFHVEYEVPFRDGWLYLHLGCFALWKEESIGFNGRDGHTH